jgi:hypothetical protein
MLLKRLLEICSKSSQISSFRGTLKCLSLSFIEIDPDCVISWRSFLHIILDFFEVVHLFLNWDCFIKYETT